MSFRVDLPMYRGPLDLLLYLVRRHELSLTELSLATLVDQYVSYLDLLQEMDLSEIGDFLELAATLVEMKSQAVLPKIEDPDAEPEVDDTGNDLVERLLEYKQIRDAASVIEEMSLRWQTRYERMSDDLPVRRVDPADQPIIGLEIWDLVSAFGRIMRESSGPPATEVIYDDTPIHVYMKQIHERLGAETRIPLIDLVQSGQHKSAYIGWFLAMLELTRHHGAAVRQDTFGEIEIVRTEQYHEQLAVQEVDNQRTEELDGSNLGMRMR
ncbi:MAG: segregation/condensation protein A [Planctomycetota bacterium]